MKATEIGLKFKTAMLVGALCGLFILPSVVSAAPALVQAFGVAEGAQIDNAGFVHLVVLVTDPVTGDGIGSLGSDIPTTGSPITLPAGWTVTQNFGTCNTQPVGFTNQGGGAYVIDLRGELTGSCSAGWWGPTTSNTLSGLEYAFTVRISTAQFEGSGLAFLQIGPRP